MSIPEYLIEAPVTIPQLARKLVTVGEGHNMMYELRRALGDQVTSELQPFIDTVAIYGEINAAFVPPSDIPFTERIELAARVAFHSHFGDKSAYRTSLLFIAALAVHAIKELDNEQHS